MEKLVEIVYYMHSGFSCAIDKNLYIFDYWEGEKKELKENKKLHLLNDWKQYKNIYVFVSHSHPDHFDPVIYEWKDIPNIHYIISYDVPDDSIGHKMFPNEKLDLEENVIVTTYESTDLGVAYLLDVNNIHIFHAGDLNFWHWREESSAREIEEAEVAFKNVIDQLKDKPIDIAFFPVDPRQGRLFDAGANFFAMTIKPRLMIPMHFWGRNEVIIEYARRCRTRETEILPMIHQGEKMIIEFTADGYMTINILTDRTSGPNSVLGNLGMTQNENMNPFNDSDLPVQLDEE